MNRCKIVRTPVSVLFQGAHP